MTPLCTRIIAKIQPNNIILVNQTKNKVITMEELLNRIIIDPNILAGKPVIKGTRIPVYLIVELMAGGMSIKEILKEYPELEQDDIKAALLYASKLLEREIIVTL